jgi:hypothetical protein
MAIRATVIPVMIASPGDVHQYRSIARDVLHEWNYIHTVDRRLVLMPVGWETHSSPELGATAQELINDRLLEDCDALIGVFWTRLGTPTANAASGTVEEIQRHVAAGRPALIYFSNQPVAPASIDQDQYKALQTFRKWCESKGLVETFSEEDEFRAKLSRQIQIALQDNPYLRRIVEDAVPRAPTLEAVTALAGPVASDAPTLSTEARELLLAAANDQSGAILVVEGLSGSIVQGGQKQFGEMNNRRVMARWEYGVDQLVALRLIAHQSTRNHTRVYQVTDRGFRVADQLGSAD